MINLRSVVANYSKQQQHDSQSIAGCSYTPNLQIIGPPSKIRPPPFDLLQHRGNYYSKYAHPTPYILPPGALNEVEEWKEGSSVKQPRKRLKIAHGSPVTIFSMHVYHCFSVTPLTDYSDRPDLDGRDNSHELQKSRRGGYFH